MSEEVKVPDEVRQKIDRLGLKLRDNIVSKKDDVETLYKELKKGLPEDQGPERDRVIWNYRRDHEFLSGEIDERSHQVWILGSLFVPISFLIFTYSVINNDVPLCGRFLLMVGSLTCYFAFYLMYRRITLLNNVSYPYLHALELVLGLSAHLKLREFWLKWPFLQRRVVFFTYPLFILLAMWIFHLLTLTLSPFLSLFVSPFSIQLIALLELIAASAFCILISIIVIGLYRIVCGETREEKQDP